MTDAQGPLDVIPRNNYQPHITLSNYHSTKQMIEQVLSEDQDYVSWKIKNLRTGGTMNNFLPSDIVDSSVTRERNERISYNKINKVPSDLTFVRDIADNVLKEEVKDININELSYEDQFKLLVMNLDVEQTNRFEVFHRTALNKGQVKKLASMVCNQTVGENVRVFLQAIGKVFAGEIIELALEVRKKWFVGKMINEFDRRKEIAKRLKKYFKKLTLLVESASNENGNGNINNKDLIDDSVNEDESDSYYSDEEEEMRETEIGNQLLKSDKNTQEIRSKLINQYNKLVKEFNKLDVSVEKYNDSPILPEHIREAWRLYQLQNDNFVKSSWRSQGEGNGNMFR